MPGVSLYGKSNLLLLSLPSRMPIRQAPVEEQDLPNAIAWEDLRTNYWSQQPFGEDLAADARSRAFGHRLRLEKLTR